MNPNSTSTPFQVALSTLWQSLSWYQFLFYYHVSETPILRWLCPIFCIIDRIMHIAWRFGRLLGRFFRWLYRIVVRYYPRMIRGSVRFIFGYVLLIYVCSTVDIISNIPGLENLLQHAEWLYEIAAEFVDINLRFVRILFEKFHAHAVESDTKFIIEFDRHVEYFFAAFEAIK
jgi:hypothetical protein